MAANMIARGGIGFGIAVCFSLVPAGVVRAACELEMAASRAQLLQQWQQLRPLQGHFDGAPWQAEIDRWQGKKYCVMEALRVQLTQDKKKWRRVDVEQWFGIADLQGGDQAAAARLPCSQALQKSAWLWYRWRGMHDGLLFQIKNNKVENITWCMAGE